MNYWAAIFNNAEQPIIAKIRSRQSLNTLVRLAIKEQRFVIVHLPWIDQHL
jgi:hypothetical protein